MTRSRRLPTAGALAAAAALVLTGCGTTSVSATDSDAPVAPTSAGCKADSTKTATGPVTITDGVGRTVELDAPAKRVVVLEWQQIEDTLTLCVTPTAVADPEGYGTWVKAEKLPASVQSAGTREEPDLDAIAATKPDLVIVEAFKKDDEKITKLEKRGIPVLATLGADTSDPIGNMKKVFTTIAKATGRTNRADEVLDQFDEHLASAKAAVQDADLPTKEFLFFDGWIEGGNVVIRPYGKGALFTALGEELGLQSAWTDEIDKAYGNGGVDPAYGLGQTDIEGLTAVGSANLFYANDEEAGSYVTELDKSSIWTALPAVEDGRAHAFPAGTWGAGGPLSNEQAIDAYVDAITAG